MFGCARVADENAVGGARASYRAATLFWSTQGTALACFALLAACTEPQFATPDAGSDAGSVAQPTSPPSSPLDEAGTVAPTSLFGCDGIACGEEAGVAAGDGDDASTPDAGPSPEPDAGLDPVRANWVGHYAARSALFSFDDPLKNSARLLSLVTIKPTETGGLTIEEEMCLWEGGWNFFASGQLRYTYARTKGESPLRYKADSFESDLIKVRIGYGDTPSECRSGATLPRSEPWLTNGTCDCPRSEDTPTSVRDCRVIDQEDDKKPGATFVGTLDSTVLPYRVAQEERAQFLNGYRRLDRLYADRVFDDTTHILECTINGKVAAPTDCPSSVAKTCPSKYNKAELSPVPAGFTCAQVIAQEQSSLFMLPLPSYPQSCPAEVSNGSSASKSAAP